VANWLRLRREPDLAAATARLVAPWEGFLAAARGHDQDGHRIFLDPWADDVTSRDSGLRPPGPAELP
jgi:hypothetical protein